MKDKYDEIAERVMTEVRGGPILDVSPERTSEIIARAIRKSVAEEREACARIADMGADVSRNRSAVAVAACEWIAERIRAREGSPTK